MQLSGYVKVNTKMYTVSETECVMYFIVAYSDRVRVECTNVLDKNDVRNSRPDNALNQDLQFF